MPRFNPDVVFRDLDGEAVILDLGSGTYFGLNDVGTRVWQLIGEGHDEARIAEIVSAEYDADPATIARDVSRLLAELRDRRLILADATDSLP
jgi:Coenzyme PQQ synthesis protein D (PqqD)